MGTPSVAPLPISPEFIQLLCDTLLQNETYPVDATQLACVPSCYIVLSAGLHILSLGLRREPHTSSIRRHRTCRLSAQHTNLNKYIPLHCTLMYLRKLSFPTKAPKTYELLTAILWCSHARTNALTTIYLIHLDATLASSGRTTLKYKPQHEC